MYQHWVNSNHALAALDDFTILNSGYKHKKYKKKNSKAIFIKNNIPNFNKHDISVLLKLRNWDFNTLILTSDIDFPKSDIIIGWVLPEINNILIYWFPIPFFIVSIVLTSCTFFS